MEIIISTQKELDDLPSKFDKHTTIIIKNDPNCGRLILRVARENSTVKAYGNSTVEAYDNSTVEAYGNSTVEAYGNSTVRARGNSTVRAYDNSTVRSYDNSAVEAYGNSTVRSYDNSTVEACGNSTVEACGNSTVVACGNSTVVACGNSTVVACGNSTVEAYGNSTVEAYDNSTVEAYDNSGVHLMSITANVILFAFAVCWVLSKGKVKKKNKTATIIYPTSVTDSNSWIINQGLKKDHGNVVVFKRVSFDFKTQENTHNETIWEVNKILTHPSWDPSNGECGEGKFHACSRPYFCDEFRSGKTDKYIALKVNVKDMFAWPNAQYPYKIAFRKCKVLYVCDKFGKKI